MDPFRLGQRNNEKCFITQREKHVQPVKRTKSNLVTPTAKIIGNRLLQKAGMAGADGSQKVLEEMLLVAFLRRG